MIYRKLTVLLFLFLAFTASSQTLERNLANWANSNPIEKLYLHLDRDAYTAGQTIWFKGYFLSDYIPSSGSTSMNVELLNDKSQVILRKVFPAFMSESFGQLQLPENLISGVYFIRGYSAIMLNQPGHFFMKKIAVFGKQPKTVVRQVAPAVNVVFFPEGGNLIYTLMNNVAFKAVDENGMPTDISLEIRNNKNEIITNTSSSHDGMGYFSIVPQMSETYYATIVNSTTGKKFDLPVATNRGVTLNVRNSAKGKQFKIEQLSGDETFKASYMIGQMQNQIVFKQALAGKNLYGGVIPTDNMLSGILQITVFNKDDMPLAERLTFIDNKEYILPATFIADTINTGERKRNHYSISLPDTVIGNFSVSITDADYETTEARDQNIYSNFLLSSDLKGYVHNPSWYFSSGNSKANLLDLVMMTNGWSRFKWQDVVKNTLPPPVYKDNAFITLKGKINLEGTKKPFANRDVLYFRTSADTAEKKRLGAPRFLATDSMGNFRIDSQVFFGATNYLFSDPRGNKSKYIKVKLDADSIYRVYNIPTVQLPFKDTFSTETVTKMADSYNDYLKAEGLTLEGVTVKTRVKSKQEQLEERYASGMFAGGVNSRILDLTDEKSGAFNILDFIQGRLAGVNVSKNSMGEYSVTYRDGGLGTNKLTLYLDEVQMDASFIESIPVSQIAYVKLMGNFVGTSGGGGALAIYTKKGADVTSTESSTDIISYTGYEVIKEFYNPDYDLRRPEDSKADNRLTLMWTPSINLAHVNPRIPIIFYNNDRTKKFKIIAEGVTNDGRFLMIEKIVNP